MLFLIEVTKFAEIVLKNIEYFLFFVSYGESDVKIFSCHSGNIYII